MRKIDRSGQRRHGLDALAINSSMSFGWFFLECPCRIAVPIDRAERLEGFRCIRLHRHQVVSVVDFDDAAGGISDCVQRVYRDNMSGKRHFFEKRRDGSSLATLVMKTVTGNGLPRVMRVNQHSTVTHFPHPTVTHLQEGGIRWGDAAAGTIHANPLGITCESAQLICLDLDSL